MSSSAYVVPFDRKSSGQLLPGLNPAELWAQTPAADKTPPVGTTRTFYKTPASKVTTLSSLGEDFAAKGDAKRELLRKSVGSAVKELKNIEGVKDVTIDASVDPQAACITGGDILFLPRKNEGGMNQYRHSIYIACRKPHTKNCS